MARRHCVTCSSEPQKRFRHDESTLLNFVSDAVRIGPNEILQSLSKQARPKRKPIHIRSYVESLDVPAVCQLLQHPVSLVVTTAESWHAT